MCITWVYLKFSEGFRRKLEQTVPLLKHENTSYEYTQQCM